MAVAARYIDKAMAEQEEKRKIQEFYQWIFVLEKVKYFVFVLNKQNFAIRDKNVPYEENKEWHIFQEWSKYWSGK